MKNKIRQAVSIIFYCDGEVFSITRQNFLKAFPGYTAFPGGKVDSVDTGEDEKETLLNTLYREVQEELDIDLEELQQRGDVLSLNKVALASSPDFNPNRYETHFYLVQCREKIDFNYDSNEVAIGRWIRPELIVEQFEKGKLLMVKPVLEMYRELSLFSGEFKYINFDDIRVIRKIPQVENIKGLLQLMPLSNTLPPATRTNCFILGEKKPIALDPSPKDNSEKNYLVERLKELGISRILLTHHHGDHHQFANDIARELGLRMWMSKDTHLRIQKKYGANYFQGVPVDYLKEGDIIGQWLGQSLHVIEIPGHDEGHIGVMPRDHSWIIVGDLFQGIGTVVVGGDEGDMTKYMNSLKKVIQLNPMAVIPSHGIPLGGANILQKTLDHRILREEQVWKLYENGHNIEKILDIIYFDLPEKLRPYARANINSHLDKLFKDNKIKVHP